MDRAPIPTRTRGISTDSRASLTEISVLTDSLEVPSFEESSSDGEDDPFR